MDEEEEEEEVVVASDDVKEEVGKLKKIAGLLWRVWLEAVDQVITWLESTSDDYRDVVTRLAAEGEREGTAATETPSSKDKDEEEEEVVVKTPPLPHEATPTLMEAGVVTTVAEVHPHRKKEEEEEEGEDSGKKGTPMAPSSPPAKPLVLLTRVQPTSEEKEEAEKIQKQLGAATESLTRRPKRLLQALYYWSLSHFDYVVFFFVILAIMRGGVLVSIGYAAILFIWGLLSIPWPSKRFWVTLIFYTMSVLVVTYIYLCVLLALASPPSPSLLPPHWLTNSFVWALGVSTNDDYFGVAIFTLLLLMVLIFHRGLLRVRTRRRRRERWRKRERERERRREREVEEERGRVKGVGVALFCSCMFDLQQHGLWKSRVRLTRKRGDSGIM